MVMQRRADVRNLVAGYEDVDRHLVTRLGVDTSVSPVNREGEAEIDKTAEDMRTLWIDVDGQQERHKEWRAVVQESHVERFPDCPVEGPDTVMHLLKHEMWCREHHIDRRDRTYHELETLTEVIMLGGAYDQLKMPSLISFEKVSRRLQLDVEAHAEVGQAPSWKMARYLQWGVDTH